jgi:signal transduction histidine kinase
MGLRHRSIRFRVGILIAVPVLSLIALYFFAASFTLGGAIGEAHARTLRNDLIQPVSNFQAQLNAEQYLAVLVLKHPTSDTYLMEYSGQQSATQAALSKLQAALKSPQVTGNESAHERVAIGHMLAATKTLLFVRNDVRAEAISLAAAVSAYDSVADSGFPVMDQALEEQTNVPLVTQALDLVSLARVGVLAAQEADLMTGVATDTYFPGPDRVAFAELATQRQQLLAQSMADLDGNYRAMLTAAAPASVDSAVTNLENHVIATSWRGTAPATVTSAPATLDRYAAAINAGANRAGSQLQAQAQRQAGTVFLQLLLAGALGLVGIIASVALSLILGRSLISQLRDLRSSALALAHDKLPHVIRLLREGQPVDTAEYDRPAEPTRNEIEQVQQSFDVVQKAAVQSAVDEARLRRGVSDVFRNLAGRSLSLLQRQLALLDSMERRASEPAELEDLFRLDHLTTRMRRHAEGLIILSGAAPSRTWRHPVQLVDVLRAAVAEVEDYTRIRVLSRTTNALAGHAIADVIHLIAELAENATVFSPPSTTVRIRGDLVGRGFAVEIEDRGLGISAARLAEINANLADPPPFDLAGSDRLGLFIAGQLAKRHDISITLQPSVFGGITAVVLIPLALVVADDVYERDWALEAAAQPADVSVTREALAVAVPDGKSEGNGHASSELDNGYARLGLAATAPAVIAAAAPLVPPVPTPGAAVVPAPVADAAPSVLASLGDELEARVTTAELAELGLPLRVRQASLAPQLRDSASGPRPTVVSQDTNRSQAEPAPPSPDAARDTVSALQRGWQLGRAEAGAQPSEEASDRTGEAAGLDTRSGVDDADSRNRG